MYQNLETPYPIGSQGFFEHVRTNAALGHRVLADQWTCDNIKAKKRSERDERELKLTCSFLGSYVNRAIGAQKRFLTEFFLGNETGNADKSLYEAIEWSVFRKQKIANTAFKKRILSRKL